MRLLLFLILLLNPSLVFGFLVSPSLFKKTTYKLSEEINALKAEQMKVNNELSAIKVGQVKVATEIGTLKSHIERLELRIGQMNTDLSAKFVGYDRSIDKSLEAGRDIKTTTTIINDPDILQGVLALVSLLFVSLLSFMVSQLRAKQKWIENLMKSSQQKDNRIDSWMQEKLGRILDKGEKC